MNYDVIIIGGGASGLAAALAVTEANPALRVGVFERQNRVGRKLLATGNGRCNLTNMTADESHYPVGGRYAQAANRRYPPSAVRAFFDALGVMTVVEAAGRVYPLCGQASAVLDALRLTLLERRVEPITDFEAARITPLERGYRVESRSGEAHNGRSVIVACGGPAAPALGGTDAGKALLVPLGFTHLPRRPALTPLVSSEKALPSLKGVRCPATLTLDVDGTALRTESGEVLFAEYGVSGIVAMQLAGQIGEALSRKRSVAIRINFLAQPAAAVERLLRVRRERLAARALSDFLTGIVHKRLGQALMKAVEVGNLAMPAQTLTDAQLRALAHALTSWTLPIHDVKGWESAQVATGGIDPRGFALDTLEAKGHAGLYACGETLAVQGDCGGFNLQWAWASGLTVGYACARR